MEDISTERTLELIPSLTLSETGKRVSALPAGARADYATLSSQLRGQFLFGWTPNPGTSFYVGYNDDLTRNGNSPFTGQLNRSMQHWVIFSPRRSEESEESPAPGSPVAVGEGSGHVVLADVNRDGRLDLVTQHLQRRVVTVQLGDGMGRFATAPGSPLPLAYSPGDIKLGDVNNDGMLDLGVTSSERDTVDIFLGNGSGRFSLAPGSPFVVSASVEFNTRGLQLVDINEDGKLDIITTSNQQNTFATLLGNGRGGFSPGPAATFPAGQGRYAFAFGDLDGDGHLDAVIGRGETGFIPEPGRVVMLRGDGKGAFKNLSETPAPARPRYVTLGDVNGDQRPDIVFSHDSNQLGILLNQGGGKFAPAPASSYDFGLEVFAVAVVDVNQDQRNDLVVATVDSVTVLLNGKSGFAPAPGSPFRAGPGAYHLATGDVNRDGKLDVAASSFEGKTVTMLLGR